MRLEIDEDLVKVLDEIRAAEWSIQGRGHSDTVRFLAKYYRQHKAVEEVLDERLREIPRIIRDSFLDALSIALTNLLRVKDERS